LELEPKDNRRPSRRLNPQGHHQEWAMEKPVGDCVGGTYEGGGEKSGEQAGALMAREAASAKV
jgi:hypothetical protein